MKKYISILAIIFCVMINPYKVLGEENYTITLTPPGNYNDSKIYVDGIEYKADYNNGSYSVRNGEQTETVLTTIGNIELKVESGNLMWFNGEEWVSYGKAEELEAYYYPIIAKKIKEEESIAESKAIEESIAQAKAIEESIAQAKTEASKQNVTKPAVTNNRQTQAQTEAENYDNDSSSDNKPDSKPDTEPATEPETEPDNSGDGEDIEWSDDIL